MVMMTTTEYTCSSSVEWTRRLDSGVELTTRSTERNSKQAAADHIKRVILVFGGDLTSDAKKVELRRRNED